MAYEIVVGFVLSVGILLIMWCLTGLLLMPVFSEQMVTVYYVRGEGKRMESSVRGFSWFRDSGQEDGKLLLVDCGLTEEGRRSALALQNQYPWVEYCTWEKLGEYLCRKEDTI